MALIFNVNEREKDILILYFIRRLHINYIVAHAYKHLYIV